MVDWTAEQFAAAKARGEARLRGPRAESARYDAGRNRIVVRLTTGFELGLTPSDVEGLQGASPEDLKAIEVQEFGLGLHFPRLDADLYVPSLVKGVLGTRRWMAVLHDISDSRSPKAAKPVALGRHGRRSGFANVDGDG